MSPALEAVRRAALALADRVALVDDLLTSLDPADPALDAAWSEECRRRFAAHEAGEMEAIDAEAVFRELEGS